MLIFGASAPLALLSDMDRPGLARMLARAYSVLVVPPRVDAEIVDDSAALMDLAEGRGKKLEEGTGSTLPCRQGRPK